MIVGDQDPYLFLRGISAPTYISLLLLLIRFRTKWHGLSKLLMFFSYGFELYGPIRHKLSEINPESPGDADSIGLIATEEMADLPQLNLPP